MQQISLNEKTRQNEPTDKLLKYVLLRTSEVKNVKQRQSLVIYLQKLFQRKSEMKWIEFEYCIVLPFKLLGVTNIPIKSDTLESDPLIRNYIEKQSEEIKMEFQQKILKLPCVSPVILIEFQLTDEMRTHELMEIIERLSSRYLPTKKCNEMIEMLKDLNLLTNSKLPVDVTFSQTVITKNTVTENDVYTIIKNHSIALFT